MKKFQPNRNDKLVFSFNLFLILFCLQSAKCHVKEFRNVWLALLKWLGFCLGTKKDVAKMIKKSRATHNVIAAWHTEAEKSVFLSFKTKFFKQPLVYDKIYNIDNIFAHYL